MDVQVADRTNRRQTQTPAHQAPPCTLVIFGAGGDLTKRLLMPAIYNLAKAKLLSDKFAIIAVDRTPKPVERAIIWQRIKLCLGHRFRTRDRTVRLGAWSSS
jgi:glucose-6-phosphate 1-dehydrogenase